MHSSSVVRPGMPRLVGLLRQELKGYTRADLRSDVLAGLTVGAVALPLALAFGVASGADAAAGLVTAIIAGIVITLLGGTPYQISGPTGAMSAILIGLAGMYGLQGIWIAGLLAGAIILALGLLRLGRVVTLIPSPVITGFTAGIALIIALGQLDNALGVKTPTAENQIEKLAGYLHLTQPINWQAVALTLLVIVTMVIWPRFVRSIPGSLVGIVLATLLAVGLGWQVPQIGAIPQSLILEQRLHFSDLSLSRFEELLAPALAIAALGAIESLLCGAAAGNMTGIKMDSNQELIGQGIGNMLIPFFGGVPATAAIARTSVAIKSGSRSRLTSIVHALVLLLAVLALGPLISQIPLAALAGVLMVTAFRMNEWETIHFFVHRRIKQALFAMLLTMLATVLLDLTMAILIGVGASLLVYLQQSAQAIQIADQPVALQRLRRERLEVAGDCPTVRVIYVTGPLFFGTVNHLLEVFGRFAEYHTLIISMRGVPVVDAMGIQALYDLVERQQHRGGEVFFAGVQPAVRKMLDRARITALVGEDHFVWSADEAILSAHRAPSSSCATCSGDGAACPLRQLSAAHRAEG